MVVPHRSQARLRLSLPHWAYSALLRPQGARFVRPSGLQPLRGLRFRTDPQFSMVVPRLRTALRFACAVFRVCGALRAVPQFGMVVPLRSQARLWHSLLHWAYYGLFPPLAAAFVRPSTLQPFGPSTAHFASLRVLATSAASRPPISRCARRSSAQRLPCARGAVGVSRLRGCRLRGCRFHRFRFGLRPSGINQCARIAIWHIHDIASAPYALRPGARRVHQDPHKPNPPLRPAPRGQTLRPPPARRRRSSDTDSRSGSWLRTAP